MLQTFQNFKFFVDNPDYVLSMYDTSNTDCFFFSRRFHANCMSLILLKPRYSNYGSYALLLIRLYCLISSQLFGTVLNPFSWFRFESGSLTINVRHVKHCFILFSVAVSMPSVSN
jgi:hypothetical protein